MVRYWARRTQTLEKLSGLKKDTTESNERQGPIISAQGLFIRDFAGLLSSGIICVNGDYSRGSNW